MRAYIYTNDNAPETVDTHSLMYTEADHRSPRQTVCLHICFLKANVWGLQHGS